jgi:hypothetical protein
LGILPGVLFQRDHSELPGKAVTHASQQIGLLSRRELHARKKAHLRLIVTAKEIKGVEQQ